LNPIHESIPESVPYIVALSSKVPIADTPEWFALEFRPWTCQIKAARLCIPGYKCRNF